VYRFASVVPEANVAVLSPTGQTYDEAYTLYLDNIRFQVPNDPKIEAELVTLSNQLTTLRTTIDNLLATAENDYLNFAINGQGELSPSLHGLFFEDPRDMRKSSDLVLRGDCIFRREILANGGH